MAEEIVTLDNTETFGDTLEALKELISHLDNFPARVTERYVQF